MKQFWSYIQLARPQQWLKNAFVLAPLPFGQRDPSLLPLAVLALTVLVFCLLSSAVYAFNDLIDVQRDRTHPRKRYRPVASGSLSAWQAIAFSIALAGLAGTLSFLYLPVGVGVCASLYVVNSLTYCLILKNKVIADVISISIGFILRLLAGCFAADLVPSSWLVLCGYSLAQLLGFGKRRSEIANLKETEHSRSVLAQYNIGSLDIFLAVSCGICLLSYMLYTVSPETIALHRTNQLSYTVPIVAYGLFRYIMKVQQGDGDGPTEILTSDPVFALLGLGWMICILIILYVPRLIGGTL